MERFKIFQFPITSSGQNSDIEVLSSIFMNKKDYERSGNEDDIILRTRERFQDAVEKHNAPVAIPIIFRNHSQRMKYVGAQHKKKKMEARIPPEESFVIFTFGDDIYANVIIDFIKDYPEVRQKPYLLHNKPAKIICLKQEFSAEDAFEEALSLKPLIYADDIQIMKQSPYVDPDTKKWRTLQGCMAEYSRIEDNETQFIVDFSVIYPENIWSTAYVLCYDCGNYAEIALCEAVKESARREIWQSIAQTKIQKEMSERGRCVIRLPIMNSVHEFCSFREGLIGYTALTRSGSKKPSLYVRVRLTFFTNEDSRIGNVLHKRKWTH